MRKSKRPDDFNIVRALLVLPVALLRAVFMYAGKLILAGLQLADNVLLTVVHGIVFYGLATPVLWVVTSVDAFLETVCAVVAGKELHNYLNEEAKEK